MNLGFVQTKNEIDAVIGTINTTSANNIYKSALSDYSNSLGGANNIIEPIASAVHNVGFEIEKYAFMAVATVVCVVFIKLQILAGRL